MNRMDERKEIERPKLDKSGAEDDMDEGEGSGIAGAASTPRAARRDEAHLTREKVSREADDPMEPRSEGEDSSMGRSKAAAERGARGHERYERREELGERGTVKGGREIMHKDVDADHVIGKGGGIETESAEGYADMASAKANRKEAMEPEREMNEKAAMGGGMHREPTVPTKNTMGWGERETIAKHTI